jgi:GAF domain-containing protein
MTAAEDAEFIAETPARLARLTSAEAFLSDLVRRLQMHRVDWHWVGIYLLVGDTLRLGPFVGAPTEHVAIPVGTGVCGTAVARDTNIIVDDVRATSNYLACSIGTRSELVVLIRDGGQIVGQFDVDSDNLAEFNAQDSEFLERLAAVAAPACRALRDQVALEISAA